MYVSLTGLRIPSESAASFDQLKYHIGWWFLATPLTTDKFVKWDDDIPPGGADHNRIPDHTTGKNLEQTRRGCFGPCMLKQQVSTVGTMLAQSVLESPTRPFSMTGSSEPFSFLANFVSLTGLGSSAGVPMMKEIGSF